MLEGLPHVDFSDVIHRLASLKRFGAFARRRGLSIEQARDIVEFMGEHFAEDLIDAPFFRPKPQLDPLKAFGETRFSDGAWPVFYGAMEESTAEQECLHHYALMALGDASLNRVVYYSAITCRLQGESIDLRPKGEDWPDLVAEDYSFCQGLGREATALPLDAFLAPSARRQDGSTVPVFSRQALSDPAIEATVRFSWDPATGSPAVERSEGGHDETK